MATKKAVSTAKKSVKKPTTAAKKPAPTKAKTTKPAATVVATATKSTEKSKDLASDRIVRIVSAEIVGTFVLTMVALLTFQETAPLYVGLTVMALVLGIGAVSGAHINPAVTFGLWSMRKLKTIMVPFYWAAQFIGAMGAVLLINAVAKDTIKLSFDKFLSFNGGLFAVELVGMAVFMFILAAAVSRKDLSAYGRAFGIGVAIMIGALTSGSLLSNIQSADIKAYQAKAAATEETVEIPRAVYVKSATLNPAVALATTEKTDSQLTGQAASDTEKQYSRLGVEVILATLVGAALGGNLYLLLSGRKEQA